MDYFKCIYFTALRGYRLIALLLLATALGCGPLNAQTDVTLYIAGGTGHTTVNAPAMQQLTAALASEGANSALLLLGDNVLPAGVPDSSSALRPWLRCCCSVVSTQSGRLKRSCSLASRPYTTLS